MGYDKNFGIISAPVGVSDVQHVLGVASPDLATLCSSVNINPMAKYKPVRYSKKEPLSDAERASVRYGLGAQVPSFAANNINPSVTWAYEKVRPGTDWSRITDFNRYYHRACVPFAFDVTGALQDGVGIQVYVNSSAGNYYQEHMGSANMWRDSINLSLSELFANKTNASLNGYIGFCIHDLTKGDNVVVVTNRRLSDISSSVETIVLYGEEKILSGVTYPAIPMLNDQRRAGNTFRFIAAIFNNGAASSQAYAIQPNTMTVYSLAIMDGADRRDIQLFANETIMGLKMSLGFSYAQLRYVGQATVDGVAYLEYRLQMQVVGVFTTPSGHWAVDEVGVALTVRSDYGYVGSVSGRQVEIRTAASGIQTAGTSYTKTLTTQDDIRVFIYPQVPQAERSVTVSGYAYHIYERKSAENVLKTTAMD